MILKLATIFIFKQTNDIKQNSKLLYKSNSLFCQKNSNESDFEFNKKRKIKVHQKTYLFSLNLLRSLKAKVIIHSFGFSLNHDLKRYQKKFKDTLNVFGLINLAFTDLKFFIILKIESIFV